MGLQSAEFKGWQMLAHNPIRVTIASILSFWAGNLNGMTTVSVLFERSSHVSGRIANIGIFIVNRPEAILLVANIWLSFVAGSFLAVIMLKRSGLTRSLLLVSVGVSIGALAVWQGAYAQDAGDIGLGRQLIAFILPLTMGFQNSITSQLPLGRTTHWTGDSTDLGIALAKSNYSHAIFVISKIFSFIAGAALGAYLILMSGLAPHFCILFVATGIAITTIVSDYFNKRIGHNQSVA